MPKLKSKVYNNHMSMEPFDYLNYKKNKTPVRRSKKSRSSSKRNVTAVVLCLVTFFAILIPMLCFISSKSSKVDIEYGMLGNQTDGPYGHSEGSVIEEEDNTEDGDNDGDDDIKPVKYTIDKRLFFIMQEEKAPSISKVLQKDKEQAEVISKEQFEIIKNNSSDVAGKKPEEKKEEEIKRDTAENVKPAETLQPASAALKPMIKPKIMPAVPPAVKPLPKHDLLVSPSLSPSSKVLVGKYATAEEAKEAQTNLSSAIHGGNPYVKKIGGHFSIQIGVYDNFETAKSIAAKLQARGFEAWILQ